MSLQTAKKIESSKIITKIRKQFAQEKRKRTQKMQALLEADLQLTCYNSKLTWSEAFLLAEQNIFHGKSVSNEQIIRWAAQVREESFVLVMEDDEMLQSIPLLLKHFPVMLAEKQHKRLLIDIHDLVLEPSTFILLLQNKTMQEDGTEDPGLLLEKGKKKNGDQLPTESSKTKGRVPFHTKFPGLVECATNFIKEHSFLAQSRRRSTTITGTGVGLKDIQNHLLESIPGLKEQGGISLDTIHHLMVPPRKNSTRARRYKKLIDAKVPKKRNDYREENANQHFLFARVRYREEFAVKFQNEAAFYSSDDMNKIRMGPSTAVSRYHQQFRFFLRTDSPNLCDHDFPHPGYLISPSGYMRLEPKENSITNDSFNYERNEDAVSDDELERFESPAIQTNGYTVDKLGRNHFPRLKAGPSQIILRACKFHKSSGLTHVNDLLPILSAQVKDGKGIAFVKVDNGPDWNLSSLVNEVFFCRLWRRANLDILGIVSYAAKWSAYNNIEHLWSPMSKKLANVILPSVLPGDLKPPYQQTHLSAKEIKSKEAKVFYRYPNFP